MKNLRVWLDDTRPMPEGFDVHVRTAKAAIEILKTGKVSFISFDHDLADEHYEGMGWEEGTGYQVAQWIEKAVHEGRMYGFPEFAVHSSNPVGRERILAAMNSAKKLYEWRKETVDP